MIKNVILSTLAIAVLAGCSGKKDWDSYIERLNSLGLKRAQEIQKNAYDRFMKN